MSLKAAVALGMMAFGVSFGLALAYWLGPEGRLIVVGIVAGLLFFALALFGVLYVVRQSRVEPAKGPTVTMAPPPVPAPIVYMMGAPAAPAQLPPTAAVQGAPAAPSVSHVPMQWDPED